MPPLRLDPVWTDSAALREMIAPRGGETPRGGDERLDARVSHAIDNVLALPARRHKPAPLQTGQMVGNTAAGCADRRREICDRVFSTQQDLQHAKAGRIPEHPEVPRLGRKGRARRRNNPTALD